ncbi:hypothetical protein ACU6T4_05660 [Avibacterium paragallinarum]|uniref:hypothetical protein n=1 Tax=Avibacterium paragallinarum TaxID=728 RepID=UPI00021ACDA6|nr:hypothetical protein [Avibacterium paragallinarum]AZI14477.1 hypothetical protein EIA51_07555 [Avibacterium paragallinarum]QIR11184.1 hypothetical protein HBL79_02380 [Avibacterium paragallinarum]QJE09996.1 hypothetical protein HHJ62_06650 [Avibacterium paragallinarum]QJE12191.1 hypothetical protein HHJ61_06655 [Avibacterium paragallinarum]QJE14392.1 hypothetical protein HHJ60_06670 [Avibacterium paragallinarum]
MPFYDDKRCQEAQLLMDSVLADVNDVSSLQLDSVEQINDKLGSFNDGKEANQVGMVEIRQAILDGINAYEKAHGCKPGSHLVASALEQGKVYLDDAIATSNSMSSEARAMVPRQALIAIKSVLFAGVPFAYYLQGDKNTGEAPLIIISHHAGNKTGMYDVGGSLNGVSGGNPFITSDRTHTLTSSDKTNYSGKITSVMTDFAQCDQSATVIPLYPSRTQIMVNGLVAATTTNSKSDTEMVSAAVKIGDTDYSFTATVKIQTGEVTVAFTSAVPENTVVAARGYLNVEDVKFKEATPSVKTIANKYTMFAKSYRSKVVVTPEAERQFSQEMGIDPATEGTMMIRMQFAQEHLYKALNDATTIAKFHNANEFDFDWDEAGKRKSQEEIAKILLSKIDMISQEMANRNGSHGVSHIYVDDRIRTILSALGGDYFESSNISARPGSYRLGRLGGMYEVYYTPKGLGKRTESGGKKAARMLLIGANSAQPAFNPFIFGEVGAPKIDRINPNSESPEGGYWVTGKNFAEQNPVPEYAASVALLDVLDTPN